MNNQTVTIVGVVVVLCCAMLLIPEACKDIQVAGVSGLIGYLAGDGVKK